MKKQLFLLIALLLGCSQMFSQWNIVNTGTTQDLYSVDYYSPNDIWIGSFNQFVKTADGGASWTVTNPLKDPSNANIQPANLYDIAVTSPTTAVAPGFFLLGNVEYVLRTTNGGTNWAYASTLTTGGLPRYLNAVDIYSTRGMVVGNNGRLLRSTNSGATWSYLTSIGSTLISDVKFATFDTVYASGDNRVLHSYDGGATWTNQPMTGSFRTIGCDHGVVYIGNATGNTMLKSVNYGITYTTLTLPFSYSGVLYAINKDTVLAAAADGIYVSASGGQYWEKYDLPSYQSVKMFDFLNSSTGFAVGLGGYALRTSSLATAPSLPISMFNIQGSPANVCYGDSITVLNTTAPLAGYSYDWKLNGVTFSTQYNAGVRLFTASGTQTITLTVTNGYGSSIYTKTVNVIGHNMNPLVYTASADTICTGNKVGFSVPGSEVGTTYQLRKGFANVGAAQSGNGATLNFAYPTALSATTTFNMKAVKTTSCFTDSLVQSKTIYLQPAVGGPVAACVPAANLCTSEGITNVTLGSINNTTSTLLNNYFDYSCCKYTSLVIGTSYPLSVSILNSSGEHVSIWIDYNNNGSFSGSELVFSGLANPTITGSITVPATAMVFNQKLRMRVASDYDVDGLADPCFSSSFYCGQVEDYAVTVLNAPVAPTPAFSFTTAISCAVTATFTNTSYNAISYSWDFGDGSPVSTLQNPTHPYTASGTYTVSLTATNGYGSTTLTQTINIAVPVVPIAASCNPTIGVCSSRPTITEIEQQGGPSVFVSPSNYNYTCTNQFHLMEDSTYTFYMYGNGNTNYFIPFLDANNDGVFSNSEALFPFSQNIQNVGVSGYSPVTSFIMPVNAIDSIPLRMRLMMSTSFITNLNMCTTICGDYKDFTVFLSPHPLQVLFSTGSTNVCGVSTSINFINNSRGAISFVWDFGDGTTSTAAAPAHTYTATGVYTVKLRACTPGGSCDSLIRTNYITVNAAPSTPVITVSGTLLSTATVAATYQWYRNGTLIGGATASSYNATLDGTYKVIAYNGTCSATSANFSYFPVHINFTSAVTTGCSSASINFSNSTINATSYVWDFGDGFTSTATSPSHNYTTPGTYSVQLKACNTMGCDSLIRTNYITVNPIPDVTATPVSSTICSGSAVAISLTGSFPGTTFSWTVTSSGVSGASAGTGASVSQTLTAAGSTAGSVTYTFTPSIGGCTGSPVSTVITVQPAPVMTSVSSISACSGSTISIPLTSSIASSYSWIAGNNVNTTGESTTLQNSDTLINTIVNTSTSVQTVTYTITPTSTGGCAGTPQVFTASIARRPYITPSNTTTFCQGDSIDLIASTGSAYAWSTGETTQVITVNSSGNYFVVVTTSCGPDTSAIMPVTVNPIPAAASITQSGNSLISSAAYGNQWFLDASPLTDTTQNIVLQQSGSYMVMVVVGGCYSSPATYVINTTDVWPGDANHDSLVNNTDLLPIGLFYGQTGLTRSVISNSWQAYFCSDWGTAQVNGEDIKHADCNGDGTIDNNDTLAVNLNFSSVHSLASSHTLHPRTGAPGLYFVTSSSSYLPGDWINLDVMAGTSVVPVTNLYGLAFNVSYDAALVLPGTENLFYPVSWLGNPSVDAIKFSNVEPLMNTAFGAETRIDHTNRTGFGKIATLRFQADPSISSATAMTFMISGYTANDSAGNAIIFSDSTYSIVIDPTATGVHETAANDQSLTIYPNPYSDHTEINYVLSSKSEVSIEVYNSIGQKIQTIVNSSQPAGPHNYSFSAKKLGMDAGVYFVKITIDGKISMKRIVEMK